LTSSNLSITAIVRTNDPDLTVFGQATTDLSLGPWSTNGVTKTNAVDQSGVPSGTARQIFSTERGTNSRLFLRLNTALLP
jgi:trimeric autotransporter adhesin